MLLGNIWGNNVLLLVLKYIVRFNLLILVVLLLWWVIWILCRFVLLVGLLVVVKILIKCMLVLKVYWFGELICFII